MLSLIISTLACDKEFNVKGFTFICSMSDKKFIEEALKVHNEYRKRHQVPPLKHVSDISKIAQKWADHLASTDTFQHSRDRNYKSEQLGENIAMKWTSTGDDFTGSERSLILYRLHAPVV